MKVRKFSPLLVWLLCFMLPVISRAQEISFPEMKGLKIVQDYPVYHPDNLWDYIDGAADNYLNYHFVDLHIAEYAKGKKVVYKAEIYHHENAEYAFGIYSAERYPDYAFISLGTQGYQEETLVNFLKGSYYVKVVVMNESKASAGQLMDLAEKIEAALPGSTTMPKALSIFPESGKIPNSERFFAGDFLGRSYLKDFYTASYQNGEKEYTLFIHQFDSVETAAAVLSQYYEDVMKKEPETPLQQGDYRFDDGYNGVIFILWKGTTLFGFQNLADERIMRSKAKEILEKLSE